MATPVELRVGEQTYRVVSSSPEAELKHLAGMVEVRLRELLPPGKPVHGQALLLVAMALAHDLEQEKARRQEQDARWKDKVRGLVARIDQLLTLLPAEEEPAPTRQSSPPLSDG